MDFGLGRGGGDAAEADLLHEEGVGCPEHGPYVVQAPHVVQHDHKGNLGGFLELFGGDSVQFRYLKFSHDGYIIRKCS